MKQLLLLTLLAFTLACSNLSPNASDYQTLDVTEFKQKMQGDSIQLVDVRTPNEYGAGHIKGAINANVQDPNFPVDISSKTDTSKQIMIYCRSGARSARAAKIMRDMGYPVIYELKGGYLAWQRE